MVDRYTSTCALYSQIGEENQWLGIGTDVWTVGAGLNQFITNVVLGRVRTMVWLKRSQSLPPKKKSHQLKSEVIYFVLRPSFAEFVRIPSLMSKGTQHPTPSQNARNIVTLNQIRSSQYYVITAPLSKKKN